MQSVLDALIPSSCGSDAVYSLRKKDEERIKDGIRASLNVGSSRLMMSKSVTIDDVRLLQKGRTVSTAKVVVQGLNELHLYHKIDCNDKLKAMSDLLEKLTKRKVTLHSLQ